MGHIGGNKSIEKAGSIRTTMAFSGVALRNVPKLFLLGVFMVLYADAPKRIAESAKQIPQEKEAAASSYQEIGVASWYGPGFHGKETASGEIFDQNKMTAASPDLALGSKAEVTNLDTGKKVEVKITDRGPYAKGRSLDLSHAAAKKLGIVQKGTARVKIKAKPRRHRSTRKKNKKRVPNGQ